MTLILIQERLGQISFFQSDVISHGRYTPAGNNRLAGCSIILKTANTSGLLKPQEMLFDGEDANAALSALVAIGGIKVFGPQDEAPVFADDRHEETSQRG